VSVFCPGSEEASPTKLAKNRTTKDARAEVTKSSQTVRISAQQLIVSVKKPNGDKRVRSYAKSGLRLLVVTPDANHLRDIALHDVYRRKESGEELTPCLLCFRHWLRLVSSPPSALCRSICVCFF